jgi:hypothetical protein
MIWEEKLHLLRKYEAATNDPSTAATKLRSQVGTSSKAEYEQLTAATDEQAQIALLCQIRIW